MIVVALVIFSWPRIADGSGTNKDIGCLLQEFKEIFAKDFSQAHKSAQDAEDHYNEKHQPHARIEKKVSRTCDDQRSGTRVLRNSTY